MDDIIRLRNEGNAAGAAGDWPAAEALYSESIAVWSSPSPTSSTSSPDLLSPAAAEAAKTLANRSACRLRTGKLSGAKDDALASLHIQPCYARAMLLYGQADLLLCEQHNTALDAALWPFVSACALDSRFLAETLRLDVAQRISAARSTQHPNHTTPSWRLSGEEGIRHSRGLHAVRKIEVGEIILPTHLPFAFGPDAPLEACRRCTKGVSQSKLQCTSCEWSVWCSVECKSADETLHAAECNAFSSLRPILAEVKSSANSFGISHDHLSTMGFLPKGGEARTDVDDLSSAATLIVSMALRAATLCTTEDETWRNVMELEAQMMCLSMEGPCGRAAVNSAAAAIAAKVFDTIDGSRLADLTEKLPFLDEKNYLNLAQLCSAIIQTNSFEAPDGGVMLVPPPLAWVNHSCTPNAAKQDNGELRCARTIFPDEEICTAYIADLMQTRTHRRNALRSLHAFECSCRRCAENSIEIQPLSNAVRCASCDASWVCVSEGENRRCIGCGVVGRWEEVGPMLEEIEEDVERIGPVLLGNIEATGGVDEELLKSLEGVRDNAAKVLHRCHWLMHRIHSYLIRPNLVLSQTAKAAEYSLLALSAMDATLQTHWIGKADRARYIAQHHATLPDTLPTDLKELYTKSVLEEMSSSLKGLGLV